MSSSGRAAFLARGGARKKAKPSAPAASVGVWFAVKDGAADRTATVSAYVDAFLSSTWPVPLRYLITRVDGGRTHPRRAGMLRPDDRADVLLEVLAHPDVREVGLATSARSIGDYATLSVETRPRSGFRHVVVYGRRALTSENATQVDAWVQSLLGLASQVGAHHGVVPVMNDLGVAAEVGLGGYSLNGVPQHPLPDELERMRAVEGDLGTKYVRFPRWGTLYSRPQVDAVGGVQRIVEVVGPAVVRELGDAIYFQLTESVATAESAEALAMQKAFVALVAPLLPARRAGT